MGVPRDERSSGFADEPDAAEGAWPWFAGDPEDPECAAYEDPEYPAYPEDVGALSDQGQPSRDSQCEGEPVEGGQRGDLAASLARAAVAAPSAEIAVLLGELDPSSLSGPALLDAVVAGQRLASWVDAVQQRFLAAFGRPGVAVPIDRVIDAARWSGARAGELCVPDSVLDEATDPTTDPRCALAISIHAARCAAMEIGAALHLSPVGARARMDRALHLVDVMPATLAAQERGDVDPMRARILAEATADLSGPVRATVERAMLPVAGSRTPSRLRADIARTIIRLDPDGAADRAERAKKSRNVSSRPDINDLATVTATLTADKAATMMWVLNMMADASRGPGDPRDAGQRRADALTDIFDILARDGVLDIRGSGDATPAAAEMDRVGTDAAKMDCVETDYAETNCVGTRPRRSGGPPVCLTVYIAASTLAGHDDLPAELAGYGAITAGLARSIGRSAASVRTVVVHPLGAVIGLHSGAREVRHGGGVAVRAPGAAIGPLDRDGGRTGVGAGPAPGCDHPGCAGDRICGTTLDVGRTVYRPPGAMDDYVRARDLTCRFPGCRMPAVRCDLDHGVPYDAGGSTCPCNLRPLCRGHHLAKTFTGWTYVASTDGAIVWTSPLGRHYSAAFDQHPIADLVAGVGGCAGGETLLPGRETPPTGGEAPLPDREAPLPGGIGGGDGPPF